MATRTKAVACEFNVGDRVELQGECFEVVAKSELGGGWTLRLRADDGQTFPADCSAVTACSPRSAANLPMATRSLAFGGRPAGLPPKPNGLAEVINTFGDPRMFVNNKNTWESMSLVTRELPQPLVYAYDTNQMIRRVRAHKRIADHLVTTLMECLARGVPKDRLKYGGCYQWRSKRAGASLSTHTWGIAIDLEPSENPMGKRWADDGQHLDPRIVEIFENQGWFWGERFAGSADPMHFQWATGY